MTGRCKTEYIVTGATGFLGGAVVRELISRGHSVTALALPEDPLLPLLPEGAFVRFGDVTDRASLIPAFEGAEGCRVIHCAGMVSVAAGQGEALGRINVQGTENIAGLCLEYGAKRLVYVSSVHAISERPMGEVITESGIGNEDLFYQLFRENENMTPEEYRKLKTLIRDSSNETVIPVKNRTGRERTGEKDRENRYRKPEKNNQKRMERE